MDYLLKKYTARASKKRKERSGIILADSDDEFGAKYSKNKYKSQKSLIKRPKYADYTNLPDDEFDEDDQDGPVIVNEHTGLPMNAVTTYNRNSRDYIGKLSDKMVIGNLNTSEISSGMVSGGTLDSDLSPPRRGEEDSDLSPPRRDEEDNDLSPPRRDEEDNDLSPPRRDEEDNDLSPPRKDNQSVIYRDKTGRKIDALEWAKSQPKKWEKKEHPARKIPEWGKGLVQIESAKERAAKEALIASQPFARSDIDEDFDKELKDAIRWDDPMLKFDSSKLVEQKSDGKPKCRFHAPPNRYNIPPGYRWDGVVRGNGYEERRFREIARRKARNEESYINNVADN